MVIKKSRTKSKKEKGQNKNIQPSPNLTENKINKEDEISKLIKSVNEKTVLKFSDIEEFTNQLIQLNISETIATKQDIYLELAKTLYKIDQLIVKKLEGKTTELEDIFPAIQSSFIKYQKNIHTLSPMFSMVYNRVDILERSASIHYILIDILRKNIVFEDILKKRIHTNSKMFLELYKQIMAPTPTDEEKFPLGCVYNSMFCNKIFLLNFFDDPYMKEIKELLKDYSEVKLYLTRDSIKEEAVKFLEEFNAQEYTENSNDELINKNKIPLINKLIKYCLAHQTSEYPFRLLVYVATIENFVENSIKIAKEMTGQSQVTGEQEAALIVRIGQINHISDITKTEFIKDDELPNKRSSQKTEKLEINENVNTNTTTQLSSKTNTGGDLFLALIHEHLENYRKMQYSYLQTTINLFHSVLNKTTDENYIDPIVKPDLDILKSQIGLHLSQDTSIYLHSNLIGQNKINYKFILKLLIAISNLVIDTNKKLSYSLVRDGYLTVVLLVRTFFKLVSQTKELSINELQPLMNNLFLLLNNIEKSAAFDPLDKYIIATFNIFYTMTVKMKISTEYSVEVLNLVNEYILPPATLYNEMSLQLFEGMIFYSTAATYLFQSEKQTQFSLSKDIYKKIYSSRNVAFNQLILYIETILDKIEFTCRENSPYECSVFLGFYKDIEEYNALNKGNEISFSDGLITRISAANKDLIWLNSSHKIYDEIEQNLVPLTKKLNSLINNAKHEYSSIYGNIETKFGIDELKKLEFYTNLIQYNKKAPFVSKFYYLIKELDKGNIVASNIQIYFSILSDMNYKLVLLINSKKQNIIAEPYHLPLIIKFINYYIILYFKIVEKTYEYLIHNKKKLLNYHSIYINNLIDEFIINTINLLPVEVKNDIDPTGINKIKNKSKLIGEIYYKCSMPYQSPKIASQFNNAKIPLIFTIEGVTYKEVLCRNLPRSKYHNENKIKTPIKVTSPEKEEKKQRELIQFKYEKSFCITQFNLYLRGFYYFIQGRETLIEKYQSYENVNDHPLIKALTFYAVIYSYQLGDFFVKLVKIFNQIKNNPNELLLKEIEQASQKIEQCRLNYDRVIVQASKLPYVIEETSFLGHSLNMIVFYISEIINFSYKKKDDKVSSINRQLNLLISNLYTFVCLAQDKTLFYDLNEYINFLYNEINNTGVVSLTNSMPFPNELVPDNIKDILHLQYIDLNMAADRMLYHLDKLAENPEAPIWGEIFSHIDVVTYQTNYLNSMIHKAKNERIILSDDIKTLQKKYRALTIFIQIAGLINRLLHANYSDKSLIRDFNIIIMQTNKVIKLIDYFKGRLHGWPNFLNYVYTLHMFVYLELRTYGINLSKIEELEIRNDLLDKDLQLPRLFNQRKNIVKSSFEVVNINSLLFFALFNSKNTAMDFSHKNDNLQDVNATKMIRS